MKGFGWLSLSIAFRGVVTNYWDWLGGNSSFICRHKIAEKLMSLLDSPLTRKLGQGQPIWKGFRHLFVENDGDSDEFWLLGDKRAQHPVKHTIKPSGTIWNLHKQIVRHYARPGRHIGCSFTALGMPLSKSTVCHWDICRKLLRTGLHHHVTVREERKQPKPKRPTAQHDNT